MKRLIGLSSRVCRVAAHGAGAAALAAAIAILPAAAHAAAPGRAVGLRIAVVNFGELFQQSPQARAAKASLNAEFAPRERNLKAELSELQARQATLKKNEATMTQDQRDQAEMALRQREEDFVQKRNQLQEDANTRQNELGSRVTQTLAQVVESYARQQGYDLVLAQGAQGVIYATNALDITPQILTALRGQAGRRAPVRGK